MKEIFLDIYMVDQIKKDFGGVKLLSFERMGNYAVRLIFSDGHGSGIYSWELLRNLSKVV